MKNYRFEYYLMLRYLLHYVTSLWRHRIYYEIIYESLVVRIEIDIIYDVIIIIMSARP